MPADRPAAALAFNPHIAALPAYNAGMSMEEARRRSGRGDIARLASNENPDGCSPAVLAALASPGFKPWLYADPAATVLREALGAATGTDPAAIVCGNGSEEMIAAVSRAMLTPGRTVVTVVPSFGLHEIEPLAAGARVIKIPMTADCGFDIDALEEALRNERPAVFFISSPWNPVGPALGPGDLARLAAATPAETLFVLDEAYREFADAADVHAILRDAGIAFVSLRTFSKAYGLAGLRVGYALCSDPEIARVVAAAKTPFNVNAAAQTAALAALSDHAWMEASVARTRAERGRIRELLLAQGFAVAPSETNILFLDCGGDAADAADALLSDGIVVKAWREPGYTQFLRVTMGKREDNDRFLASLSAWRALR